MKKLMFLFMVLFTMALYAQTAPSSYTDHLGLRLYAGNTGTINPGKDSLDANYVDIDDGVKAVYDTLGTVKADLYYHHNYDGTHKDGTLAWDKLSTAAKATIVQTSGSQVIGGNKTFNDMIGFGATGIIKFGTFDGATSIEGILYRTNSISSTLPLWATSNQGDIDTLTTREWVRDNFGATQTLTEYRTIWSGATVQDTGNGTAYGKEFRVYVTTSTAELTKTIAVIPYYKEADDDSLVIKYQSYYELDLGTAVLEEARTRFQMNGMDSTLATYYDEVLTTNDGNQGLGTSTMRTDISFLPEGFYKIAIVLSIELSTGSTGQSSHYLANPFVYAVRRRDI